jgi:hypothetical protein
MNINVPTEAREHFWEDPPEGAWEFWSFRFKPPVDIGEKLFFRFDRQIVAQAVCAKIEPPGKSSCESTGKYRHGWKVFWLPDSFIDMRG